MPERYSSPRAPNEPPCSDRKPRSCTAPALLREVPSELSAVWYREGRPQRGCRGWSRRDQIERLRESAGLEPAPPSGPESWEAVDSNDFPDGWLPPIDDRRQRNRPHEFPLRRGHGYPDCVDSEGSRRPSCLNPASGAASLTYREVFAPPRRSPAAVPTGTPVFARRARMENKSNGWPAWSVSGLQAATSHPAAASPNLSAS
jgi:hypothetical protein